MFKLYFKLHVPIYYAAEKESNSERSKVHHRYQIKA
jgi:hypothetical protein